MTPAPLPENESATRWVGQRTGTASARRAFEATRDEQAARRPAESRTTTSDPHGYVTATIGADGRLDGLTINPHAMYDLTAAELAKACTAAVNAAWARRSGLPPRFSDPN
ncbi:hypothetical protein GCM10023322_34180 [Rugosimonospora acidiphila]|uniref:YbaB/EbfC DNA-binding family protein n=1 Tax=Rugosimonospora acidiphila TaxID=556531 RepID=A0ABP9RVP1_9ACTN